MSRPIKFRAWNYDDKKLYDWDVMCNAKGVGIWQWLGNETAQEFNAIMQYTGNKDENEIDAYESDICTDGSHSYTIAWDNDDMQWVAYYSDGSTLPLSDVLYHSKIIGNIHENPKLLEQNNDASKN